MPFALELRKPPSQVRARIWDRDLARHNIKATEEDTRSLAKEFDVTPGVASGAISAASLCGGDLTAVRLRCAQPGQSDFGREAPRKSGASREIRPRPGPSRH